MDHYYNFSNTVCFKFFISNAYSFLALTTYSVIFFQSPTFNSPGSNVKLAASVTSGHSPFWRLLKEAKERVLGKQCPSVFVCRKNLVEPKFKG